MSFRISFLFFVYGFGISICTSQIPKNLSLLSTLTFPGQSLAGCWHYEDGNGHAYALVGASRGIVIVDVTNPALPVNLFQLPGVSNLWHEVKVIGDFAYAVSEGIDTSNVKNGLQIIDLRYLPDSVPYKFYTGDGDILGQLRKAHTVTTAGNYVYINGHNITGLGTGVLICDVSDPWNPLYTGAITMNYCHDSYVRGDTIYTSDIHAGQFSVYNISDKSAPVLLATQQTPGLFNHNTWLSDDGQTIYTTDEHPNQPLASYNISDLSNIEKLDEYFTINLPANEVHNVRVFNDFLINPSYGSQVTIVDGLRPANLIEVGNFPTGTSLCWDADPYFSSGIMVATDMNSGTLYILQPEYKRACYLEGMVTDSSTGIIINGATVAIIGTSVNQISNASGEYKTGIADSGTYTITCSKSGYNSKTISGVNLDHGILTTINFQLSLINSSIQEGSDVPNFQLSPNPCIDQLMITSSSNKVLRIRIMNMSGQILYESIPASLVSKDFLVPVGDLSKGLYILELNSDQGTSFSKFQKL